MRVSHRSQAKSLKSWKVQQRKQNLQAKTERQAHPGHKILEGKMQDQAHKELVVWIHIRDHKVLRMVRQQTLINQIRLQTEVDSNFHLLAQEHHRKENLEQDYKEIDNLVTQRSVSSLKAIQQWLLQTKEKLANQKRKEVRERIVSKDRRALVHFKKMIKRRYQQLLPKQNKSSKNCKIRNLIKHLLNLKR